MATSASVPKPGWETGFQSLAAGLGSPTCLPVRCVIRGQGEQQSASVGAGLAFRSATKAWKMD